MAPNGQQERGARGGIIFSAWCSNRSGLDGARSFFAGGVSDHPSLGAAPGTYVFEKSPLVLERPIVRK